MDEYQSRAVNAFESRNHVAILGAAGTGKSHVLFQIVNRARDIFGSNHCVACAWTNNAAKNIDGITVHKLFAAKINWEWTEEGLWNQVKSNEKVRNYLLGLKVIVMDEFFTIKSNVLDAIDFVLRRLVRVSWHEGLALGGRLLVVSGDPFQLEPIFPRHERRSTTAFDSSVWYHCFGNDAYGIVILLPQNHRQVSDPRFFDILSRIRVGTHSSDDLAVLNRTSQHSDSPPNTHTRLVLTHQEASDINARMLENIVGDTKIAMAHDRFINVSISDAPMVRDRLDQSAPESIITKRGARVMLTRRIEDFFPGSELVVTEIHPYYIYGGTHATISLVCIPCGIIGGNDSNQEQQPITLHPMRVPIHSVSGELIAYREQLPVIPSYAITVHRSQSLSLRRMAIDFRGEVNSRWNPYGKVYVALSRCTTLEGLWVKGLKNEHISVSPSAHRLMKNVDLIREMVPNRVVAKKGKSKIFFEKKEGATLVLGSNNSNKVSKRVISLDKSDRATKLLRENKENCDL